MFSNQDYAMLLTLPEVIPITGKRFQSPVPRYRLRKIRTFAVLRVFVRQSDHKPRSRQPGPADTAAARAAAIRPSQAPGKRADTPGCSSQRAAYSGALAK